MVSHQHIAFPVVLRLFIFPFSVSGDPLQTWNACPDELPTHLVETFWPQSDGKLFNSTSPMQVGFQALLVTIVRYVLFYH